ncbi:hypothetical protein ACGRHY_18490 [Streptomyces sp. HK10]
MGGYFVFSGGGSDITDDGKRYKPTTGGVRGEVEDPGAVVDTMFE